MKGEKAGCSVGCVCRLPPRHPVGSHRSTVCPIDRDGHSKDETLPVVSFKEDVKISTLAWHIQHQHPQDYDVLLNMDEEELKEVAKEMSRVGG
jgi:hypothetical protein